MKRIINLALPTVLLLVIPADIKCSNRLFMTTKINPSINRSRILFIHFCLIWIRKRSGGIILQQDSRIVDRYLFLLLVVRTLFPKLGCLVNILNKSVPIIRPLFDRHLVQVDEILTQCRFANRVRASLSFFKLAVLLFWVASIWALWSCWLFNDIWVLNAFWEFDCIWGRLRLSAYLTWRCLTADLIVS